jgi:hydrophobe/amphiphile efflux-1 (HAE1) family protein
MSSVQGEKPSGHSGSFNLSAWAIARPMPAMLLFLLLCGAGLWGYSKLAISKFPDISMPLVSVSVSLPGATPAQLETEVTRKIEDAVASINKVKLIASTVTDGNSTTMIEFLLERDLNEAVDDVRDAVTRVRQDLPRDIEEPLVAKQEFVGGTMLSFAVESSAMSPAELSWFVDNTVKKAMFGIKGVGTVSRQGGVEREIRVDLTPGALSSYGVSAAMISAQLAQSQIERPGGRTQYAGAEQTVRAIGTADSVSALEDFQISTPDGRKLRLGDIARVTDSVADPRAIALFDGKPVVSFGVVRTRGASEVHLGRAIRAKVAQLQAQYPRLKFSEVASTVEEAEGSFESSMTMLWEGSALAVLVVFLFLRDWRATWISAIALPLSIIPTFAVMHWMGFSLNLITLLALAVVVGILVDDAIVEIENIMRHLKMGKSPLQAARDAADEIGVAVIATSITLGAVFVPVAFMPGIPGKFFREFGWTAAIAVLFSLLVARLLTPMMAAYQLRALPEHLAHKPDSALMRHYLASVTWALKNRAATLTLALLFFIGSILIVPFIPTTFLPPSDLAQSNLSIELPPGSTLQQTLARAEEVRLKLKTIPELKNVYSTIGGALDLGDPGKTEAAEVRKAVLILKWGSGLERKRDQKALERETRRLLADVSGVRLSFISSEPGELMQIVLAGDEVAALNATALKMERDIRTLKGLGTVTSSASLKRPEILVVPDPVRAAAMGVSTADIADAARVATLGDYRQRLAKFNLPDRQIPIRVRMGQSDLSDIEALRMLRVPGTSGPVPLSAVAQITEGSGAQQMTRFGRERNIILSVELNGRPLGEVMEEIKKLPSAQQLPPGIRIIETGDTEVFVELFTGFLLAMGTGIFCVYAVLLLLYNNAFHPITILMAVPLCAGGAFGALLITHNYLSLPALIGLLMLIGIATKNSILLVDYAEMAEHEQGMSRFDAVIDACHKRVQPVLMTSIAMGAGMMPIALGFGADSSFRAPMAVAVIGGLVTSTLLSLIVIPAVYTVIDDIARLFKRKLV